MKLEFRDFGNNTWYEDRERAQNREFIRLMAIPQVQAVCIDERVELWLGQP